MSESDERAETEMPDTKIDLEGVPAEFHQCVREHGRALWALVFNAQLAQGALGEVARMAGKHQARNLGQAGVALSRILADLTGEYSKAKGWGQEDVTACAEAVRRVLAQPDRRIQLLD